MELSEELLGPLFRQDKGEAGLSFVSLSSGSCGNCGLLTYGDHTIILDAGIGIRKFQKHLEQLAINPKQIVGIFITHDHNDHTRAAARLAHKFQWPIYASPAVVRSLLYHRMASAELSAYMKRMEVGDEVAIGDLRIRSFEVPHDATENVGYAIDTPVGRFTFVTDIGQVTPMVETEVAAADFLVFESNYDREMLQNGSYSFHLKERITSGIGHLSNHESAKVLSEHISDRLRFLALCHLSGENNTPELALTTHLNALQHRELTDLQVVVLKRGECSPIYYLR